MNTPRRRFAPVVLRLATAAVPIALTPLFVWAIGNGLIDLGGGEKDLLWIFPWLLWSLGFTAWFLWQWRRGTAYWLGIGRAVGVGLVIVIATGMVLAAFGLLGIGGIF